MWGKPLKEYSVPSYDEPGSFGYVRKFHTHEGVDLYCPDTTPVYAVESGTLLSMSWFTGEPVGMPWWEDTMCINIQGESGIVVYGEIEPFLALNVNDWVRRGDLIGFVKRVLKKDKGRPMSMLHLELYEHDTREISHPWPPNGPKPKGLLDPTHLLEDALNG